MNKAISTYKKSDIKSNKSKKKSDNSPSFEMVRSISKEDRMDPLIKIGKRASQTEMKVKLGRA